MDYATRRPRAVVSYTRGPWHMPEPIYFLGWICANCRGKLTA